MRNTVVDGSGRMMGNHQIRFQKEEEGVPPSPYPTRFIACRTPEDKGLSVKYHREQGERILQRTFRPLQKVRFNCIPDTENAFNNTMRPPEDHGCRVSADVVTYRERMKRTVRGRPPKNDTPPVSVTKYGLRVSWEFDGVRARELSDGGEAHVPVTDLPFDTHRRIDLREGAVSDYIISAHLGEYRPEYTFRLPRSGLGMSKVYLHKPSREAAMMTVLGTAALLTSVMDRVFRNREPPS